MVLALSLASGLILASGVSLPQGMKDAPAPRPPRSVTVQMPPAVPQMPGRNLSYVLIENGEDLIRLPMSQEEMDRYGYVTGQIIPLHKARQIIDEKLKRRDEGR